MNAEEWTGRTGESWAEEWKRTDRSFTVLTGHLLDRIRVLKFAQVLDIGCGAGELSLAIGRAHPDARIIGVDVSPQLVEVAEGRGERRGNVSFVCADAASWEPPPGFAPDLIISRHGVMFFDDPVAAFGHFAKIAAPQAQLLFSCFRSTGENPFFTEVGALLPSSALPPPPGEPGPFAFAEREHVTGILEAGGWSGLDFEIYDFGMIAGAGDDPVAEAVAYYSRIGPAARALRELQPHQRDEFVTRLAGLMANHSIEGIVALRAATWLVSARKA
jgi:SAM-dependent methyltransferase